MSQSLSKILLHIVFSTKDRRPWIDEAISPELYAYMATIIRGLDCEAFRVGGANDHVHIACSLSRTVTVSSILKELKASSSAWIKKQGPQYHDFAWQPGYAAFSLGHSQLPALLSYIEKQREHHAKRNFKDELVELLEKYEVDYDEQYLWD